MRSRRSASPGSQPRSVRSRSPTLHRFDIEASPTPFSPIREESPLFEPDETGLTELRSPARSSLSASPTNDPPSTHSFASTDIPRPQTNKDLYRARRMASALRKDASPALSSTASSRKRKPVEEDHENILIKDLRTQHSMDWTAIAAYLNEERVKRGDPPTMTSPAVYSRFVRNAPKIAAANGQIGFDPKDFMYLRHPHQYPHTTFDPTPRAVIGGIGARKQGTLLGSGSGSGEGDGGDGSANGNIVGDEIPKEIRGNVRKRCKLSEECAELEVGERTAMLVDAVEVIERNFWIFVADELERTCGKLYDPKVLESRFKSL